MSIFKKKEKKSGGNGIEKGVLRLGSFRIIPKELGGRAYAYRIESEGRNFALEVTRTTVLHALIERCWGDEELWEYLSCVVSMNYVMASVLPDNEFLEGFAELVTGVFGRMPKRLEDSGDEESEDEILLEERAREALREADRINGTDVLGDIERAVQDAAAE